MGERRKIPVAVEKDVLLKSARRCALCYGLDFDTNPKRGQIAHIDDDPANNDITNLCWLCLYHHDESSLKSYQSKRITKSEIKSYRDELFDYIQARRSTAVAFVKDAEDRKSEASLATFDPERMLEESHVEIYIAEIKEWASNIQFVGMPIERKTSLDAIWLKIVRGASRFQGNISESDSAVSVRDLLTSSGSHLLLGDPGSGKTTTIRLLTLELLEQNKKESSQYKYPIVIRLRSLPEGGELIRYIIHSLGIREEIRTDETQDGVKVSSSWFLGLPLMYGLPLFLETTGACLLIDGLDEITSRDRKRVEEDIERLRMRAPNMKIICTCRSGEYFRQLHGFRISTIQPLASEDQIELADSWLENGSEFLDFIKSSPYADACTRPLFMAQLMALYERDGHLPEMPSEVYDRLLTLLLRDWDDERDIDRVSKYGKFGSSRKLDFLSSLSHQLTYVIKTKEFGRRHLESAYRSIHRSFGLPAEQEVQVVREIESHTGIVVAVSRSLYSFAHLSIQEYLCARFLRNNPVSRYLPMYLEEYPAPVAITVAIAGDPSLWLAHCILDERLEKYLTTQSIGKLLNRLRVERPTYSVCPELGLVALELTARFGETSLCETIDGFCRNLSVHESIGAAMGFYEWTYEQDLAVLKRRFDRVGPL